MILLYNALYIYIFLHTFTFQLLDKPWSQVSFRFLPLNFIPHRVQQSHCSSIVHRVLLTHALALSASQFVPKKKSQRIYTSMHSAGLELTNLTYTRLEDNLIRHRGDRYMSEAGSVHASQWLRREHAADMVSHLTGPGCLIE